MRELNRLEDIYYEAKREYFEFKSELNKDKIEEVLRKMKDLQVKYANADKKDIKAIEKQYYDYIEEYKLNTGKDYSIPLGALSIQKSIKPVNVVEQSLLNLSPIVSAPSSSSGTPATALSATGSPAESASSTETEASESTASPIEPGSSKIIKLS